MGVDDMVTINYKLSMQLTVLVKFQASRITILKALADKREAEFASAGHARSRLDGSAQDSLQLECCDSSQMQQGLST
jgi:hypothetical protein